MWSFNAFPTRRSSDLGMIKNEQLEFKRRLAFFKSLNLEPAEVKTVLPDVTFDSRMTIKLGGRSIEIMYLGPAQNPGDTDRKSTRLNSSHLGISYAVFC